MKTETDILIRISELKVEISHLEKENPIDSPFFQEANNSIVIVNEKIKMLQWVLEINN